jgi:virginiamycin B lyase
MLARSVFGLVFASAVAGCAFASRPIVPSAGASASENQVRPGVVQKGNGARWVLFTPHTLGEGYTAIVLGPDKNMWFIDETGGGLAQITEDGSVKEFSLADVFTGFGVSMTVGADKNFYILDESPNVVRVTEKGKASVFQIPSGDTTSIDGLALGPDGNVWFAEFDHIAKITPAGKITEFAYPSGYSSNNYGGVTAGSDGNVWFAQSTGNAIGRIAPSTGKITMFPISVSCTPAPVVLANDGNVWFTCLTTSPLVGRITPRGKITTFAVGGTFSFNETEQFCSRGPDGDPWCASRNDGNIFRVNSKTQKVTTFTPHLGSGVSPDALAAGADGNVWIDTVGGEIAVRVANPLTVTPNELTFSAPGQTKTLSVKERGTSRWSAHSSDRAVATVVRGSSSSSFQVKSVAKGDCNIVISDAIGNSVAVEVTVN